MQIKSESRVKEYGEVYTNPKEVKAMLDLLPPMTLEMSFLEPTCGNGAFVVEIIKRKFDLCKKQADYITAIKSVVAIDILADNVEECKKRIIDLYLERTGKSSGEFKRVLDTNIFQGNSLAIMSLLAKSDRPINIILPKNL